MSRGMRLLKLLKSAMLYGALCFLLVLITSTILRVVIFDFDVIRAIDKALSLGAKGRISPPLIISSIFVSPIVETTIFPAMHWIVSKIPALRGRIIGYVCTFLSIALGFYLHGGGASGVGRGLAFGALGWLYSSRKQNEEFLPYLTAVLAHCIWNVFGLMAVFTWQLFA